MMSKDDILQATQDLELLIFRLEYGDITRDDVVELIRAVIDYIEQEK